MKKIFVFVAILTVLACNSVKKQEYVFTPTASGIHYVKLVAKDSTPVQIGDAVEITFKGMFADDTVFAQTKVGETRKFTVGYNEISKELNDAVQLMKCGEKALFRMSREQALLSKPIAHTFAKKKKKGELPDSVVTYEVELKSVTVNKALHPIDASLLKDTISGPDGLKVIIAGKGNGEKIDEKDDVTIHYNGYLTTMNFFDSSVKRGQPFKTKIGVGQVISGWDKGITMLHVGDTARLIIPSKMGYGSKAKSNIPANSTLIFDVIVLASKKPVVPAPFKVQGLPVKKTASGLEYVIVNEGTGKYPLSGNKVTVHYTGYLQDGSIFDSSVSRDEYFKFNVGMGRVIKGWDEGILLMREGAKYRFTIPYALAYGEAGYPPVIPAKATLIFDVELIKAD
jgi:peptidylprolyl isomerase